MGAAKWMAGGVAVLTAALVTACAVTLRGQPEPRPPAVSQDAHTTYPIVLAHGMMGFGYLGSFAYWRGIPERLRAHGAVVFVTQVSAFNSSEVRGEQLLAQVERIVKQTGARKVNLIGHSHGSQSARYVAAMRPDLVASVTSVAGPNTGSDVADWLEAQAQTRPWFTRTVLSLGNTVGAAINWASDADLPQDALASMHALNTRGTADFNKRFPAGMPTRYCSEGAKAVKGVRYYSWTGIGQFYRGLNPSDYVMALTHQVNPSGQDDGLVGRCSSHLGQVIRDDYPMNHFHAVNLFWGEVGPGVDPVQLYVDHAQRLKDAGL
jgi:triacylglycerol lipase